MPVIGTSQAPFGTPPGTVSTLTKSAHIGAVSQQMRRAVHGFGPAAQPAYQDVRGRAHRSVDVDTTVVANDAGFLNELVFNATDWDPGAAMLPLPVDGGTSDYTCFFPPAVDNYHLRARVTLNVSGGTVTAQLVLQKSVDGSTWVTFVTGTPITGITTSAVVNVADYQWLDPLVVFSGSPPTVSQQTRVRGAIILTKTAGDPSCSVAGLLDAGADSHTRPSFFAAMRMR